MSAADQNRGSEIGGATILDTKCNTIPVLAHAPNQDCKDRRRIERIRLCKRAISCQNNVLKQLKAAFGGMPVNVMAKPVHNVPVVRKEM